MTKHRHSDACCNDCGAHTPGTCTACDRRRAREATARRRRERDQAMRDLGLTKVRGALGGTYFE